jgi:hypothetical protein
MGTLESIIEALKNQPATLALIVSNAALLAFLYYGLTSAAASRESIIRQVLENSASIQRALNDRAVACPQP